MRSIAGGAWSTRSRPACAAVAHYSILLSRVTIWLSRVGTVLMFLGGVVMEQAQAQWSGWDYDFDREITPWKELQAQIPAYPKSENLLEFDVGGSAHRYYIDAPSISVGEDGVVRYTIVIRTAGGANNTSFEGIRCATQEQKYYAIGRSDGTWSRARNPQWKRIEPREVTRQHYVLFGEIFCNGKIPVQTPQQALTVLKRPELRRRGIEGG